MSGQIEKCPTSDKVHYQFIVITDSVNRVTGVKKLLGSKTVHVECMRKSLLANDRYVGKEETRVGILPELKKQEVKKLHPIDWLRTRKPTAFDIMAAKDFSRAVSIYYDPEYHEWLNTRPWLDVYADRLTEEEIASY